MKTLVHTQRKTSICIYEFEAEKITGSFFNVQPEVGDIIMSHTRRESNFLLMYEVKDILENRDAKTSADCNHNPNGAYFKLSVENVTTDLRFSNIDNSIGNNLN